MDATAFSKHWPRSPKGLPRLEGAQESKSDWSVLAGRESLSASRGLNQIHGPKNGLSEISRLLAV
jgi:hypothetical protein